MSESHFFQDKILLPPRICTSTLSIEYRGCQHGGPQTLWWMRSFGSLWLGGLNASFFKIPNSNFGWENWMWKYTNQVGGPYELDGLYEWSMNRCWVCSVARIPDKNSIWRKFLRLLFSSIFFLIFAPKVSCSIINMTTLILQGTHWHLNIHVWWHNFLPFLCSRILQIFQKFRFENADGLLSMGARYLNQTGHQIEKITWIINGSDLIIVG